VVVKMGFHRVFAVFSPKKRREIAEARAAEQK
jgi:hypothetical protein